MNEKWNKGIFSISYGSKGYIELNFYIKNSIQYIYLPIFDILSDLFKLIAYNS